VPPLRISRSRAASQSLPGGRETSHTACWTPDLHRIELTIWPIATAVAFAQSRASGCRSPHDCFHSPTASRRAIALATLRSFGSRLATCRSALSESPTRNNAPLTSRAPALPAKEPRRDNAAAGTALLLADTMGHVGRNAGPGERRERRAADARYSSTPLPVTSTRWPASRRQRVQQYRLVVAAATRTQQRGVAFADCRSANSRRRAARVRPLTDGADGRV